MQRTYETIESLSGPILTVDGVEGAQSEEMVEITTPAGEKKMGKVIEINGLRALIQMFESPQGWTIKGIKVKFLGKPAQIGVSLDMLGRVFNGAGHPMDNGPEILPEKVLDLSGQPINPYSRTIPSDFIQTGVSAIDVMNPFFRGQKQAIFSGATLPHAELINQIVRQAKMNDGENFVIVFGAMGLTFEEINSFQREWERTGIMERTTLFVNTATDSVFERMEIPRMALSFAEYLAFEKNKHVLVILNDMTHYAEARRELCAARKEVSGRRGYPASLASDLAKIYERAGCVKGSEGSVTQLSILSLPEDDMTHPILEATGSSTEGQWVLNRNLHQKQIVPPMDVLQSLSHSAETIGEARTREDHARLREQLFACYAQGKEIRERVGNSLSDKEQTYLDFADRFEKKFVHQGFDCERSLEESLCLGWELLKSFPISELTHLDDELIEKYHPNKKN